MYIFKVLVLGLSHSAFYKHMFTTLLLFISPAKLSNCKFSDTEFSEIFRDIEFCTIQFASFGKLSFKS